MPYRQAIQLIPHLPPLRHEPIHQRLKPCIVSRLDQMQQLMHEDVLQAISRFFSQIRIQPNIVGHRVAASPLRFHVLNQDPSSLDTQ